jgi:hypothetical protein
LDRVLDSEFAKRKPTKKDRRRSAAKDGDQKVGPLEIKYLQGTKKKRRSILMGGKTGKNRILACEAKV